MRTNDMRVIRRLLLVLSWLLLLLPGGVLAQESGSAGRSDADGQAAAREVITGDHLVEAGTSLEEIVVVGGDLTVRGQITGNAIVIGGNLILGQGGSILGDASVTGGSFVEEGGTVDGEMRTIDGRGIDIAEELQRALGSVAAATAPPAQTNRQPARSSNWEEQRRSRRIQRAFAGLTATVGLGIVLAGLGAGLVFYARPNLETVSDTIRGATLRSAGTGLAATFLALPAFVVMVVALAASIIGIPLLLIAVPLYPLALFGAFVFGLIAVAHAIGERTAEQTGSPLDLRYRNSYAYLFTGLAMLLLPLIAADLIGMTGLLGFIGTLLKIVTGALIWACCTIGLGAVILSRGGRRRTFVPPAPDVTFEPDDLFGEPMGGSSNA